jgi:hypothetical protein
VEQAVDAYVYLTFFTLLYPPSLGGILLLLSLSTLLGLHHEGIRHLAPKLLGPNSASARAHWIWGYGIGSTRSVECF